MENTSHLHAYAENYLRKAHSNLSADIEIRYITKCSTYNVVQYYLITKDKNGEKFYAKCSCELNFPENL